MTCFEGRILPDTVLKTEFDARPPTSVNEMLQMAQRIGNSEAASLQEKDDEKPRSQTHKPAHPNRRMNSV